MTSPYSVYVLLCADGTLYTGITTDLVRRTNEHNGSTKGARYTRTRQPVRVVYEERMLDRASAQKREWEIKSLSRQDKERLISSAPFPTHSDGL